MPKIYIFTHVLLLLFEPFRPLLPSTGVLDRVLLRLLSFPRKLLNRSS